MSRKFSIVVRIELDKIDDEIEKYVGQNGNFDPYIFMNEDTARVIESEVGEHNIDLTNIRGAKNEMYATYCGYKVFINNDLRFGILEIR